MKKAKKSKTLWVNALVGIITLAGTLTGNLPSEMAIWAVPILAVVNIILRAITKQPLEL